MHSIKIGPPIFAQLTLFTQSPNPMIFNAFQWARHPRTLTRAPSNGDIDIMQVLIFCELGLKRHIHAPNCFGGDLTPINGELSHRDPKKALMVAETRRLSH